MRSTTLSDPYRTLLKSQISPARQQLLVLMERLRFGRIEGLRQQRRATAALGEKIAFRCSQDEASAPAVRAPPPIETKFDSLPGTR